MIFFKNRAVVALLVLGSLLPLTFAATAVAATPPPLGDAASFGALSFSAMTNAGQDTVVHGNIGSATSIDVGVTNPGFGRYGAGSGELANAQASLLIAYGNAEAQAPTSNITGDNLSGRRLMAGVYSSSGGISIDGPVPLTLDGGGNADAVFIFQAASAGNLIVAETSNVVYVNGAQPCNVFWKVGSAFLRNTGFTFVGTILALTQITLTEDITVEGRLLARNADVTFIHDVVNLPSTCVRQSDLDAAADAATAAQAAVDAAAAAAAAAVVAADAARAVEAARVAAETATAARAAAARAALARATAARAAAARVAARRAATARATAATAARARVAAAAARRADAGGSTSVSGPALPPVNPAGFTG